MQSSRVHGGHVVRHLLSPPASLPCSWFERRGRQGVPRRPQQILRHGCSRSSHQGPNLRHQEQQRPDHDGAGEGAQGCSSSFAEVSR